MTDQWMVYLLLCRDGALYCGSTSNLSRRLAQHNGLVPGGAKYTRSRRPVELAIAVSCRNRSEAGKLETATKAQPKNRKISFLASFAQCHPLT
ncbi:MAG: GIY-YIG nuclease family protein [Desulfovibrio sp.]|nr:GIY-YIG nuclease family protein [Desulfovibrio sp.]